MSDSDTTRNEKRGDDNTKTGRIKQHSDPQGGGGGGSGGGGDKKDTNGGG